MFLSSILMFCIKNNVGNIPHFQLSHLDGLKHLFMIPNSYYAKCFLNIHFDWHLESNLVIQFIISVCGELILAILYSHHPYLGLQPPAQYRDTPLLNTGTFGFFCYSAVVMYPFGFKLYQCFEQTVKRLLNPILLSVLL